MIEELNGDFLQWLRGFYYVSQTGSIRRAAQMMNRNPSTISYQIDPRHHALDGHAVGDVHPPRPRLPEALRAVVAAVRRPAEFDARRLQLFKHGPHVGVPAVAQHGWGPAVQRLGVELDRS